jgi:hypothetical protein
MGVGIMGEGIMGVGISVGMPHILSGWPRGSPRPRPLPLPLPDILASIVQVSFAIMQLKPFSRGEEVGDVEICYLRGRGCR